MQDELMLDAVMEQAQVVKDKFLSDETEAEEYVNLLFDTVCNEQFTNTKELYKQVAFRAMSNFNDRMRRVHNKKFVATAKLDDVCMFAGAQYKEIHNSQNREVIISKNNVEIKLVENSENCVIKGEQYQLYSGLVYNNNVPYVSLDVLKYIDN